MQESRHPERPPRSAGPLELLQGNAGRYQ